MDNKHQRSKSKNLPSYSNDTHSSSSEKAYFSSKPEKKEDKQSKIDEVSIFRNPILSAQVLIVLLSDLIV